MSIEVHAGHGCNLHLLRQAFGLPGCVRKEGYCQEAEEDGDRPLYKEYPRPSVVTTEADFGKTCSEKSSERLHQGEPHSRTCLADRADHACD